MAAGAHLRWLFLLFLHGGLLSLSPGLLLLSDFGLLQANKPALKCRDSSVWPTKGETGGGALKDSFQKSSECSPRIFQCCFSRENAVSMHSLFLKHVPDTYKT